VVYKDQNLNLPSITTVPGMFMVGALDTTAPTVKNVQAAYNDLGSPQKVMVTFACTTHWGILETGKNAILDAAVEWLGSGTYKGQTIGQYSYP
jgi:hypothetical protein